MKKLFILLPLFLIVGCENEDEIITVNYDTDYYKVATPYLEHIGSYSLKSYDKEDVESMLMQISMEYFKTNNSLYQNGQYLKTEEMKNLLSSESLNKADPVIVDDVEIIPTYISAIHEQNYLATNNQIKGISLAFVLDCEQSYQNNNNTLYKNVDVNTVLEFGKIKANELVQYLKSKEELKDTKILVGLYIEGTDYLKGGFKYVGYTENNQIEFNYVNYHHQLLDSNYVMTNDLGNYNNFMSIKNHFANDNDLYISGSGLYQDNILREVQINVNSNYLGQSKMLDISQNIANYLSLFDASVSVKVNLKSNEETKGFLVKKPNSNELETYLLEG